MARAERCKQLAQVKPPDHSNYGARPRPPKVPPRRSAARHRKRRDADLASAARTSSREHRPGSLRSASCRRCSTGPQLLGGRMLPVWKPQSERSRKLLCCRT